MPVSQFQERVKELVKEALGTYAVKEEMNVKKMFPNYPSGRDRYDLVFTHFNLIVEAHGQQHTSLQTFGQSMQKTTVSYATQGFRDSRKEDYARANGWHYLVIHFKDLPRDDEEAKQFILNKFQEELDG